MALIATQVPSVAGTAPTFAAAASGDTARPGAHTVLIVKNTDVADRDVTIKYPGTLPSGDAIPDKLYTVAATNGELWIPLLEQYADPDTDDQVVITWEATAGVTRAVVTL